MEAFYVNKLNELSGQYGVLPGSPITIEDIEATLKANRERIARLEQELVDRNSKVGELYNEAARLRGEIARKDEALREIVLLSQCQCNEYYTARGLHSPSCPTDVHEEATEALSPLPDQQQDAA